MACLGEMARMYMMQIRFRHYISKKGSNCRIHNL
jgi:hypothetical protein